MERVNKSEQMSLMVEFADNGYVIRVPEEVYDRLIVINEFKEANNQLEWKLGRVILNLIDAIGDEMTNVMGAKVKNYELFIHATVNGLKEESKDNQENK